MEEVETAGKRQKTKHDAAFRAEAVRRVQQDKQPATRVAQALGMSSALPGRWVRAARMRPPARLAAALWSKKTSGCGRGWPVLRRSGTF